MELQNLFSTVLNMTITASVVIGCVLIARLALRKAPKVFSCALWLVVLFRLLCPVSVSAPVSVLTLVEAPEPEGNVGVVEYVAPPVSAPVETIYVGESHAHEGTSDIPSPTEPPVDWNLIAAWVWTGGLTALAGYGILSYVNLKRKLREAVPMGQGIREADGIKSPFVLGFLRPVIYLPSDLKAEERGHILMHEQVHVHHGDHLLKALFFLACCIHWFNPLVWVGFVLCGRDMEMRCDEAVLKALGPQIRSDYAQSLLKLAAGQRMAPAPLAFGEGDTGKRIRHVLSWKQRAGWVLIPAAVLCAVVLVITAVNPGGESDTPFGHSYRAEDIEAPADVIVSADTLYTLTSDQLLFVREGSETYIRGSLVRTNISDVPDEYHSGNLRRAWKVDGDDWWLTEQEDGTLHVIDVSGGIMVRLARADLLGISIKQPGMESYVEPVWYRSGVWNWLPDAMSTTLVDGGAQIVLMPELDTDMILVSEEYYERSAGETNITTTDYFLEPDENGDFLLDVSRRGSEGDDFAIYRVTVGEEHYVFRLAFPAVPGVTSVEVEIPEKTRQVKFAENYGYITLQIPESWEYTVTSLSGDANSAGITFWPRGREEGKLRFEYYPDGFGVCGTGLETASMTLAGQVVSVGTYDNESLWTFLSFSEYFAVWGEGHESWWAEYGEAAMEILDGAEFGEYVDGDALDAYFRDFRMEELGPGEVLLGTGWYMAVHYPQTGALRLYEYRASRDQVEIRNEWSGRIYENAELTVNVLELDGTYIYFGLFRDIPGADIHFLMEDGYEMDMMREFHNGFCFDSQAPLEDFRILDENGDLLLDLEGYLEQGFQVAEAEGKVLLDLEGEIICMLPVGPTEP